jgi:alcohol dehydrogenase class IV
MNKQIEALKMAIEALELINEHAFRCGLANDAIQACKEALAQPVQNSKGFINPEGYKYDYDTGRKK